MKTSIHFIGNAHVDPAWMWTLSEGYAAFLATCRSALARMQETDEFIFTASSAALYEFVEITDPKLFVQIQEAVSAGKWEVTGGWWVEADCHTPSGESFIRQCLYAQKYFQEKFGKAPKVGFCIDSFGHNANLPALLKHCGIEYYVFMRPSDHELTLPTSVFRWRAPGGDEVLAYRIPFHYSNFEKTVTDKIDALLSAEYFDPAVPWMLFYGVGNHGGGPTREQIAEIIANRSMRGNLHISFSSVEHFFDSISDRSNIPVYEGELAPHAIGCYSAHSTLKTLNRKAENALLRAEKFCVRTKSLLGNSYDVDALNRGWKNVLLNQFHDTIGGVSIKEACDEAISLYHESLAIATKLERIALQRITNNINTSDSIENIVVFNPHSIDVRGNIEFELWHPASSERGEHLTSVALTDKNGTMFPAQLTTSSGKIAGDRVKAMLTVYIPASGWKLFAITRNSAVTHPPSQLLVTKEELSNEHLGISFAAVKSDKFRYFPAAMYNDNSDTWSHGIKSYDDLAGYFEIQNIEVVETGPIRGLVRVISTYESSSLIEDFILYYDSDELILNVTLDFRNVHALVKMRFGHGIAQPKLYAGIASLYTQRVLSKDEHPFQDWICALGNGTSFAVLTDSKSSYSCTAETIDVTCARSPLYAHHTPPHIIADGERGEHLDIGIQHFSFRITCPRSLEELSKRSLCMLQPLSVMFADSHDGTL